MSRLHAYKQVSQLSPHGSAGPSREYEAVVLALSDASARNFGASILATCPRDDQIGGVIVPGHGPRGPLLPPSYLLPRL
ncbi:hypothetical protein L798_07558 [Zootermopsis nevadensis]|uniref:Uncharacterized protein n=1 Tax=Zootermopsis nevadensis TaxID=136037 RepID=A0A067REB3_ZOONE|nr:hypothetical protein L798_07558 [Zootermopsis nevadensis]